MLSFESSWVPDDPRPLRTCCGYLVKLARPFPVFAVLRLNPSILCFLPTDAGSRYSPFPLYFGVGGDTSSPWSSVNMLCGCCFCLFGCGLKNSASYFIVSESPQSFILPVAYSRPPLFSFMHPPSSAPFSPFSPLLIQTLSFALVAV